MKPRFKTGDLIYVESKEYYRYITDIRYRNYEYLYRLTKHNMKFNEANESLFQYSDVYTDIFRNLK